VFQEDSAQFASQKIRFPASRSDNMSYRPNDVPYRPDAHQTKASSVRTTWVPIRTFLCVEKLQIAPACIRPKDSAARPDNSQCSIKLHDFFPKHRYRKIAATVRTTGQHRMDVALKQERFLAKFFEFRLHSCPSGRPMTTVRMAPSFIKPDAHLNYLHINRGPLA
jgi:hypothetical protein